MGYTRKALPIKSRFFQEVSHILVDGTDAEIGRQLATEPGKEYGVQFACYEDRHFAEGRRRFYQRNWPAMWRRIEGVAIANGADANDKDELRDFSALVYDMSPSSRMRRFGCSAVSFPTSRSGGPLVARNYDAWERLPAEMFDDDQNCRFSHHLFARPFVMQIDSTDRDEDKDIHKVIAIGGHDLLCPFQDALNDAGLFVTTLADRVPPLTEHMAMAGGRNAGLSSRHIMLLLASRCATVAEAKSEVLAFQPRMDFGLQWLIADARGDATVLAIDKHGCFIFSDRSDVKSRPLAVTNHPLFVAGWREEYDRRALPQRSQHYDSFNRHARLEEAIEAHPNPYQIEEAETLMDRVASAYRDPKQAGTDRTNTFTAWSLIADLANRELRIRFNCGASTRPHPDDRQQNQLQIDWAEVKIGFEQSAGKAAADAARGTVSHARAATPRPAE